MESYLYQGQAGIQVFIEPCNSNPKLLSYESYFFIISGETKCHLELNSRRNVVTNVLVCQQSVCQLMKSVCQHLHVSSTTFNILIEKCLKCIYKFPEDMSSLMQDHVGVRRLASFEIVHFTLPNLSLPIS